LTVRYLDEQVSLGNRRIEDDQLPGVKFYFHFHKVPWESDEVPRAL